AAFSETARMDLHYRIKLLCTLEEGPEARVIQIDSVDIARYLHTLESECFDDILQLSDRRSRVLHRHGADRNEPTGMLLGGFSQSVILEPSQLLAKICFGPVVVLGHERGQYLNVNTHRIHGDDAFVGSP